MEPITLTPKKLALWGPAHVPPDSGALDAVLEAWGEAVALGAFRRLDVQIIGADADPKDPNARRDN